MMRESQLEKNFTDQLEAQKYVYRKDIIDRKTLEQNFKKKFEALSEIIQDYNKLFGTNHSINEFDLYYQDLQTRIKNQKYSNKDYPHKNKIDITIVVDMLLTGFDSKYLNTLYIDKNLKHHGLIQALSRTNRVLNDTKPHGNILDFRLQKHAVDQAIVLFSGVDENKSREIWLVDPAPVVIQKFQEAVQRLDNFMEEQGLACEPQEIYNVKGDAAKIAFIKNFKEVQRQFLALEQFTDLEPEQKELIENILPKETLLELKVRIWKQLKHFKNNNKKKVKMLPKKSNNWILNLFCLPPQSLIMIIS